MYIYIYVLWMNIVLSFYCSYREIQDYTKMWCTRNIFLVYISTTTIKGLVWVLVSNTPGSRQQKSNRRTQMMRGIGPRTKN